MSGNLSHSMRSNYETQVLRFPRRSLVFTHPPANRHGVSGYYTLVSESYRNPHFGGLKKVMHEFLDRFMQNERPAGITVLDLAAGSGEATEVLLGWKASRWPSEPAVPTPPAVADVPSQAPAPMGRQFPNRAFKPTALRETKSTQPEPTLSIAASDPFTSPAYLARTGLSCLELSFADVAEGKLPPPPSSSKCEENTAEGEAEDEPYDIVVVSFALHLVETPSELWALLTELSKRAKWLVVTAPHKKPDVKPSWGWRRWDPSDKWAPAEGRGSVGAAAGDGFEIVLDSVRLRVWRSEAHWEET